MPRVRPNRIKPSHLRALVTVSECENFGDAALKLEISQSAVSHAIASLEEELGITLLQRGRQGASLTPAGQRIIPYANQVLHLLNNIVDEAQLHKTMQAGQLKVAAVPTIFKYILAPVIVKFRETHPQIMVSLVECYDTWDVERAVRDGQVDLGLTHISDDIDFEVWDLGTDEYLAILPPSAEVQPSQIDWETLAQFPIISYVRGNSCYVRLKSYFQESGIPLKIVHEVRDNPTVLSMVEQGLGAAVVSRLALKEASERVQICRLPKPLERRLGAIALRDKLHPPPVFAFLDFLKQSVPQASELPDPATSTHAEVREAAQL